MVRLTETVCDKEERHAPRRFLVGGTYVLPEGIPDLEALVGNHEAHRPVRWL